jgi:hypothetical protein
MEDKKMKTLSNVSWTGMRGHNMIAKIEIECKVIQNVAYADGYNIPTKKESYKRMDIRIIADGKQIECTNFAPQISSNPKVLSLNCYAIMNKVAIKKEVYEEIMNTINRDTVICETDDDYQFQKAIERAAEKERDANDEKDAKEYLKQIKNGLCPKCGSYCYGDCES